MKKLALISLPLAALMACQEASAPASQPVAAACTSRAYDNIGGPISMTDHTGARVTEEAYKGKKSLVYFGFTNCPDVCPFTLQTVAAAMDLMPENIEKPRTILISVDPEADTPEALSLYIDSNGFPDDMVGLTGTPDEIRSAADNFKTTYNRIEDPSSTAGYTMDHVSILFLMSEDWKLETFFTSSSTPQDIASCLAALD